MIREEDLQWPLLPTVQLRVAWVRCIRTHIGPTKTLVMRRILMQSFTTVELNVFAEGEKS